MSVLKIAGKTANNTVQGVKVSGDGDVMTRKVWQNEVIKIYEDENAPAKGTHRCTAVDLSDAGAVSLRISNSTDVNITVGLYIDYTSGNYAMRDSQGQTLSFTVEAGKTLIMITPDDWPVLQWLANLKVYFTNSTAATSGTVQIWAVVKR